MGKWAEKMAISNKRKSNNIYLLETSLLSIQFDEIMQREKDDPLYFYYKDKIVCTTDYDCIVRCTDKYENVKGDRKFIFAVTQE